MVDVGISISMLPLLFLVCVARSSLRIIVVTMCSMADISVILDAIVVLVPTTSM